MSRQRHELHQLTGAYAADALAGPELAEFEKHLEGCPSCAEEVRGLREGTARLGMATAIVPPPQMRERVLAAALRTRQVPPAGGRLRAIGGMLGGARLPRAVRPPLLAAAMTAMAAAIVVLAVLQSGTQHQLRQAQDANRAVAVVLAAPDARIATDSPSVGGTVTAVISSRDHAAVVTAAGMPALSGGRVYELWVLSAVGARPSGLMQPSDAGPAAPVLAEDVQRGDRLGITIEPAGGSAHPTSAPVAVIAASA